MHPERFSRKYVDALGAIAKDAYDRCPLRRHGKTGVCQVSSPDPCRLIARIAVPGVPIGDMERIRHEEFGNVCRAMRAAGMDRADVEICFGSFCSKYDRTIENGLFARVTPLGRGNGGAGMEIREFYLARERLPKDSGLKEFRKSFAGMAEAISG